MTERTAATRFERLRSQELATPMRAFAGLRHVGHGDGRLDEAIDVRPWLREADGTVGPPALLILADSTLAAAVGTVIGPTQAPVTRRFSLELVGRAPVRADRVTASARVVHADGAQATVRGEVHAGDALIALASMRTAIVADRQPSGTHVPHGHDGVELPADATSAWALEPIGEAGADGATVVRTRAQPRHANSIGTLHGGAVAAIGERAVHAAIAGPAASAVRPVLADVVVDYVRPIPADGAAVEVRVEVAHRSARSVLAHARVTRADGAVAALVRATVDLVGG